MSWPRYILPQYKDEMVKHNLYLSLFFNLDKQVVCRCLPPVFKEGEPNLIITPSGMILTLNNKMVRW